MVAVEINTASVEVSLEIPQKKKVQLELSREPATSPLGIYPQNSML